MCHLLRAGRPLLLSLSEGPAFDLSPWADRVRGVRARCDWPWALPVRGEVSPPEAALIRPDGHVAWVGSEGDAGLPEALTRWFGAPKPA